MPTGQWTYCVRACACAWGDLSAALNPLLQIGDQQVRQSSGCQFISEDFGAVYIPQTSSPLMWTANPLNSRNLVKTAFTVLRFSATRPVPPICRDHDKTIRNLVRISSLSKSSSTVYLVASCAITYQQPTHLTVGGSRCAPHVAFQTLW